MSRKTAGKVCALICMITVAIYIAWGMIAHSYDNAWIVYMLCGITCAGIMMFSGKKDKTGNETPKEAKKADSGETPEESSNDEE